ncbi:redoxin domain-containing protein [Parasphingopyxis lamellibrachiae]|uniref:Peroxiredoxin n=1 Tax=Parasphingopyxis lamellibrachiae TaxID=680125 RepID=A0A3D9FDM4_9SPHN|nr:redoxin domain-containing protein [Parasphingopyxis lamellibrachiae]RED15151.1 peroxiredoxin [Parasphingopyxis lamellibrachiae]
MGFDKAKPLTVSHWLNTNSPISLEQLHGRVVLIEAFQMLCPGCVSHALPQAMRVRKSFRETDVMVIGLHSVFEHHAAQGAETALKAFLHEYRISFPVAIDAQPEDGGPPITMAAYGMRGTPTTLLIDRQGFVRKHSFGQVDDLVLGAEIMALMKEDTQPQASDRIEAGEKDAATVAAPCHRKRVSVDKTVRT